MKVRGIRISDSRDRVVSVELPDILEEIRDGNLLQWSILYLEATGDLGEDRSIADFEEKIFNLEDGLYINWEDLNILSKKFNQVIDIIIIGSKSKLLLRRYTNDHEMYETCDVVIQMIDSSYWEVFSQDKSLIDRLSTKFKKIKLLNSWEDLGEVSSISW